MLKENIFFNSYDFYIRKLVKNHGMKIKQKCQAGLTNCEHDLHLKHKYFS